MLAFGETSLKAQSRADQWNVFIDGENVDVGAINSWPLDSLNSGIEQILELQQKQGYYLAHLDSFHVEERSGLNTIAVYFSNGPRVPIHSITITGAKNLDESELSGVMDTRINEVLDQATLTADIDRIVSKYGEKGFHFAKVQISDIQIVQINEDAFGLEVILSVDEGVKVKINDVLLVGAQRTRKSYLEFLMGTQNDDWLQRDLDEIQAALEGSRLFSFVYPIELIHVDREEHIMVVSVEEEQPGTFDLVLGYQPPGASGGNSGLVGNGHLDLRNPFGYGRRIGLRLNRLPGQISSVDASFIDTYFFGTPFSLEAGFEGLQQDSTFSQRSIKGAIGYSFQDGLETYATVNRQVTRPGQSGLALVQNVQRIPRSEVTFWGFSIRYNSTNNPLNPQRGLHIETSLEGGRKIQSSFERSIDGDTTTVTTRVRQQRLEAFFRLYMPVFTRQVLVIGNDAKVLVSENFDESDLYRLGGAQSLRGYDEDRFRGRLVSRTVLEWRYLFERTSFAYIFVDVGYLDRPDTPDFDGIKALYPGYGLGMQFETGIGLINTSLALSTTDAPSQAKVHVGLSLGL